MYMTRLNFRKIVSGECLLELHINLPPLFIPKSSVKISISDITFRQSNFTRLFNMLSNINHVFYFEKVSGIDGDMAAFPCDQGRFFLYSIQK